MPMAALHFFKLGLLASSTAQPPEFWPSLKFVSSRFLFPRFCLCVRSNSSVSPSTSSSFLDADSPLSNEQWDFPLLIEFLRNGRYSDRSDGDNGTCSTNLLSQETTADNASRDEFLSVENTAAEESALDSSLQRGIEETERNSYELELASRYKSVSHELWTALLRTLCRNGEAQTAIAVLSWIEKKMFSTCHDDLTAIIIEELGKDGSFDEAFSFADTLEMKGMQAYNALIEISWMKNEFSRLLDLIKEMRQEGFKPFIGQYRFAIQACIKSQAESPIILGLYENILEDQVQLDEQLYNDVIYAVSSAADAEQSLCLLKDMKSLGFIPNGAAYTCIIVALSDAGRMDEAQKIFDEMKSFGRVPKSRAYSTLIRGYAKKGKFILAKEVMQSMMRDQLQPTQQAYSVLIDACVSEGNLEEAWACFKEMKESGLQPDAFIYGRLMTAFKANGQWFGTMKTLRKMQEAGVSPNRHVYNIAIDGFSKHRKAGKAREIFQKMISEGIKPDVITWNSLIECHFRAGETNMALHLFAAMKAEGCAPSSYTYNILFHWLGRLKRWKVLEEIMDGMNKDRLSPNPVTYTTLVNVYGQSGRFQDALECLKLMSRLSKPEASVYCALANAYARQGLCEQAMGILKKMEADGLELNVTMLNSVLNSFSVAAKPEEGLSMFEYIMQKEGITPNRVTYTTLMKSFINAGKFEQAMLIYNRMIQAGLYPDKKAKDMRRYITKYATRNKRPQLK